ncbi:MAG: glycosyltransferase family 9 protein, partial [Granulicella sp.]
MADVVETAVRRVLIYRLGSLGDTVVALPSLRLVARAFPEAERRMLTNFPINAKAPPAEAILKDTGLVQGYFRYAVGTRSVVELARLWWTLVRWRPEVLVYLAPVRGVKAARRDAKFFRLCGIRRMIGVPVTEAMQQALVGADGSLEPEAERLARSVRELGEAHVEDPANWSLGLTAEEMAAGAASIAELGGRSLLAVSIGTKVQANDWGVENWRALLGRVAALYPGYGLAMTGAAVDVPYSEAIAAGWREGSAGPVVNLCGKLTPRESAAVFGLAKVFLGHDSGPMHLAAAMQTPCVAIFSARGKPRTWFPYGRQHRVVYHRVECWGCGLET